MDDIRFELNLQGLNELMKSPEMQSVLLDAGHAVAGAAGSGYAAEVHTANYIAISNVYPDSREAAHDNFKNNSLLQAVGKVGLRTSK